VIGSLDELARLVPYIVLISVRVGIAFASLPPPVGSVAPAQVRAVLGVFVAAVIAIPHTAEAQAIVLDPFWLGGAAVGEALVGAAIGLTARLCIAATEAAGEVISGSIGLGFAQAMDPTSGQETSVVAHALIQLAVLAFFVLGGHHAVIAGLARSLDSAPPGAAWNGAIAVSALEMARDLVGAGLRIASPVMGTMLIVQMGVALASRAAPRLQVFSISFAVAASVGLLTLFVAIPATTEAIAASVREIPTHIAQILAL